MVDRATVEGWLAGLGLSVDATEVEVDENVEWGLAFRGGPFLTAVVQPAGHRTYLDLQVAVRVSDDHREALASLGVDDRDMFEFLLREALLSRPVGYNLETTDGVPSRLVVGLKLFHDSATESGFFRRNHQIQTAATHGALLFRKVERFGPWWRQGG